MEIKEKNLQISKIELSIDSEEGRRLSEQLQRLPFDICNSNELWQIFNFIKKRYGN